MAIQATISLSIIFMSVWMAGMTFLIKGHFNNNGLNPIEHPISAYCAMSKSMHDMRLMKIICAVGYIILLADYLVFFGNQNVLGDKVSKIYSLVQSFQSHSYININLVRHYWHCRYWFDATL